MTFTLLLRGRITHTVNLPHALTVFIPLCDVTPINGPTQFILGSHRAGESEVHPGSTVATNDARAARATTFYPAAGSAIAFDYQVVHRGLQNAGLADRPVLYFIVGRPIWKNGCKGLPRLDIGTTSLFTGQEIAPLPPFRLDAPCSGGTTSDEREAVAEESAKEPEGAAAPRRSSRKRQR